MEIGTEISRKIRTAIKGKLQELGAYVDEELPDYIMVMVANKKSQEQMTDDLSLFLGNNTSRFTTWLQGVLDKLRSVTPESNSLKASEAIIFNSSMPPLKSLPQESGRDAAPPRQERAHSMTSSEPRAQRSADVRVSSDVGTAVRLTSAVRPLYEFSPSEAVIDIKLDSEDPFSDDLSYGADNSQLSRKIPAAAPSIRAQRPAAPLYRPPGSNQSLYQVTEGSAAHRLLQGSGQIARPKAPQVSRTPNASKLYDPQDVSATEETYMSAIASATERAAREGDSSRKRKIPVASSVVKVRRLAENVPEEEEEEEEDEEDHMTRAAGLSSSVSVPSRPERRPTLPPSKQANKNLILKAISEAQESITRTTNYSTAPPKQTVPVAPRARLVPEEELILLKSRASMLRYQEEPEEPAVMDVVPEQRRMDVLSRLQPDPSGEAQLWRQEEEVENLRPVDSRSFILKRPKVTKDPAVQGDPPAAVEGQLPPGRLIQPREIAVPEKPPSPKFIVTLEGVPSPPGYMSDHEPEEEPMCYTEQGDMYPEAYNTLSRAEPNFPLLQDPSSTHAPEAGDAPTKAKIPERCKYWPACKNAERCTYHHPTTPCKAFPKCRFADKCFFIHPNCKFDAKCAKADCPYTHASRRTPVPLVKPAHIPPVVQQCRFFPACKKTECPFYHPKHCRFSNHCTRPDCEFYHPTAPVPPRHALTWTRTQASSD
ncbi:zinc finger CCCH domain-containing protein 14 isoform X3 [Dendropsophus ebraccatus]|uniref:zinc finger CCCH domain-containing protein 14 isoform X3 n=1 Tax=Dendropsophus ebraccatus TaxID=150705 RepID=UPI00383103F0